MSSSSKMVGKNVSIVVQIFISALPLFMCHVKNTDETQHYAQEVYGQQESIRMFQPFFTTAHPFTIEKNGHKNELNTNNFYVHLFKTVSTKTSDRRKRQANNMEKLTTNGPTDKFDKSTIVNVDGNISLDLTTRNVAHVASTNNLMLPPLNQTEQPTSMKNSPIQRATKSLTVIGIMPDGNERDTTTVPGYKSSYTDSQQSTVLTTASDLLQTEILPNKASKSNKKVGYKDANTASKSLANYFTAPNPVKMNAINESTQRELGRDNQTAYPEVIVREIFCYQIQCGQEQSVSVIFNVEPTVVPLGTNVTFECNVAVPANNNFTIWWTRRHSSAFGEYNQHVPLEYLKEEIILASGTANETIFVLSLLERSNVSLIDSGYYTCSVQLQVQCCHVNATTQLIAYHPPHHNTDLIIIVCVCILQALIILFVYTKSRQIPKNEPKLKDIPMQTFQYTPIKNLSSIEEGEPEEVEPEDINNDNEFEDEENDESKALKS